MAITIGTLSSAKSGLSYSTWGLTLIGTEIFVGTYSGTGTSIYVYDADTYAYKRTLTTSAFSYAMGTDETNLYVKNSSNQMVLINKDTGATISTKTNVTFAMSSCASFKIDLVNDRIYYCDYNTTLYIKKYSDGTVIATYTMPANVSGVDVIKDKYIIVCSKGVAKYFNIAPIPNNNVTSLVFTQYTLSTVGTGVVYYNGKLIFSSYSTTILSGTISGLNLYSTKYLIKQNSNYYTIKSANYDSTTNHNFTSLTLNGGTTPNASDIDNFGFDDTSVLTNSMTVGSDTFIPVLMFDNTAELKKYKPS